MLVVGLGAGVSISAAHADTPLLISYETLKYGETATFLTGIRGTNIVGNYVIPGTTETGGLYYDITSGSWAPMPVATENGANFPGAIGSSPYGPSFGTPSGILRTVGSYQTEASAPYDLSYLFDGAAAPGEQIINLIYPNGDAGQTLYTIAHSNFGNQVVGNYDTDLATGNAFIYDIDTGTYTNNNLPGAISTTAYGIYGGKIAGGYSTLTDKDGPVFEHGYIYDQATGTYTTHDHPGAIATHFEGITGAGRAGEYNLVTNWITADGETHPAVLHVAADGTETWYEIDIPGEVVSSNSAYGPNVVGIYILNGELNGYLATIPGIYNPIDNTAPLVVSADQSVGIATNPGGDDVINQSSISVSGSNSIGIQAQTYGVITNLGTITTTGSGSSGVEMNGTYGTLLNYGTMSAVPGATAISTGATANGTVVVNTGTIDGRVVIAAGPYARFENSGWLGMSVPNAGTSHQISGIYAQTSAGTLGLRIGADGHDSLQTDTARLAGTLDVTFDANPAMKQYGLVSASQEITGEFGQVEIGGLPDLFASWLGYSATDVTLNVAAAMAELPGNTANQKAVGAALDGLINNTGGNTLAALPEALAPLYALGTAELPLALGALSGEGYASETTVLAGDSLYSRQAVLGRLRQGAYAGQGGAVASLGEGGPALAYGSDDPKPAAVQAIDGATSDAAVSGHAAGATLWGQVYGGWADLDGGGQTADVSESLGGIISGADIRIDNWLVGAALGYSQSNADVAGLGTSFQVDSLLLALYAGTNAGPLNLRLGASYAFNQIDADRTIAYPGSFQQASAEYNGGTAQAFAEVGYGFAVQKLALEPFAGLAFVNVSTDGFTETGATAGLSGASTSSGIGYSSLGIRAATDLALSGGMVLQPRASLAWQYAFGDITPETQLAFISAPGAAFTVGGVPLAENTALVELGADLLIHPQARIGLSYVGQFAEDVNDNALQANLSWSF